MGIGLASLPRRDAPGRRHHAPARIAALLIAAAAMCLDAAAQDVANARSIVEQTLRRHSAVIDQAYLAPILGLGKAGVPALVESLQSPSPEQRFKVLVALQFVWGPIAAEADGMLPAPIENEPEMDPEHIRAGVIELPKPLRAAIDLHYFAGLSQAEAAQALGIGEGACAMRLSRARERLRGLLRKRGVGTDSASALALVVALPNPSAPPALGGHIATQAGAGTLPATTIPLTTLQIGVWLMSSYPVAATAIAFALIISVCVPLAMQASEAANTLPEPAEKPAPTVAIAGLSVAKVGHPLAQTSAFSVTIFQKNARILKLIDSQPLVHPFLESLAEVNLKFDSDQAARQPTAWATSARIVMTEHITDIPEDPQGRSVVSVTAYIAQLLPVAGQGQTVSVDRTGNRVVHDNPLEVSFFLKSDALIADVDLHQVIAWRESTVKELVLKLIEVVKDRPVKKPASISSF